ncbi:hypothetical protein BU24DRAFT_93203 [Aaosphaeria arxii CBS 175.79]|uniref:Life-span regulatory factor-domain-containing protein n=1 Tax=Aaosphaeria arxii CBS 175.79 TaxID=1450172 RepID=A0A6A5X6R0_9PLEO|nr:uncharacterized protein BU24DRAFT_93203 [Aaosphaeria arxii CBS 175.79]KAF2008566.1 hypothetical protein BU24DRAFT_93203 [Aaosphaeria arxii CBS 175.79]
MATHHSRPSTHSKRPLPPHARPSKPSTHSSKRSHLHTASKSGHKAVSPKEDDFEDEEVMATSFLQYCTTCEKQIIVPNNSVLYCSESCRKKDNEKELTFSLDYSPPLSPFTNFTFDDIHFKDIVPLRSPTAALSNRSSVAFSELSSDDNATSSDDKSRHSSNASLYLHQVQSGNSWADLTNAVRPARPRYNRASTSSANFSAAPSLSHTPGSTTSFSMPYTPATTRPLPPRTNPHTHSASYHAKSVDLVTPLTYTTSNSPPQYSFKALPVSTTSKGTVEGEILYEKSPIPSISPANSSLRQLFASTPRCS